MNPFDEMTPEKVLDRYRRLNLQPARGVFIGDGCACPIGAYLIEKGIDTKDINSEDAAQILGVDVDVLWAFTDGFDAGDADYGNDPPELAQVYEQGIACRDAVWPDDNG